MRYVLDACNLIFQDRRLEETLDEQGFAAARELLVRRLSRFAYQAGLAEIVAVFDGSEKAAHRAREERREAARVTLRYANPREQADRWIIEYVESVQRPGELTVVTNDKFIIRNVKAAQAHHLYCREFLLQMSQTAREAKDPLKGEDPRKFKGLTGRELDYWMEYLGLKKDE